MKYDKILAATLLISALQAVEVGKVPPEVTLSKKSGGLVSDGSAWSSKSLRRKVTVMFYVDPDEKELNEPFAAALKKKKFDRKYYRSIGMINMAATWKPNFAIQLALESKQKQFPDTIYVKDMQKVLVKKWDLADDSSDILIFGKDGKVLFHKDGRMGSDEITQAIKIIEKNL